MITDAHFEALRQLRQHAQGLNLACSAITGVSALMHKAFDREVTVHNPPRDDDLLRKLRSVK